MFRRVFGHCCNPETRRGADAAIRKLTLPKKLGFALLATGLFLLIVESTLRLIGFRLLPATPEVAVNGRLVAPMFRHSHGLVWEPIPGAEPFNANGFVGPTIPIARVAGTARVATVGDSCTQFGEPPYAELLRSLLAEYWARPVEVLNAGVAGYSSEQGLLRLERNVLPYRPDVITLYFGWNDHWMPNRVTDREIALEDARSWTWVDYIGWSRVVQAGLYLGRERRYWQLKRRPQVMRVPLERFRTNLERMIQRTRSISAEPILVTAPTDMGPEISADSFPSLLYLSDTNHNTPKALHDAYVEATRDVARCLDVRLVDAAARFDGQDGLITSDHIHLTQPGITVMAKLLAEEITSIRPVRP